jgi:hypothetical protein
LSKLTFNLAFFGTTYKPADGGSFFNAEETLTWIEKPDFITLADPRLSTYVWTPNSLYLAKNENLWMNRFSVAVSQPRAT